MKKRLVSVIVTTRNSASFIRNCLESIKNQTYLPVEIILVDNHSTDDTKKISKRFTKNIFIAGPERSTQRNFGVKKAKGEYILFLDSDMRLNKTVIDACVKKINSSDIKGIYIPEKIIGSSFFARVRNFERSFYNETVIDAVRFVKKTDYVKVGGFDESLFAGEDWDFDKRIRKLGDTASITSTLFHDEAHTKLGDYFYKKAYYSTNLEKYIKKWKNDNDVKKQFSIYYRYVGVFIEKNKWKKLITHPALTIGMYFLRFIVGLTYLMSKSK